jgi:hypothetical protein
MGCGSCAVLSTEAVVKHVARDTSLSIEQIMEDGFKGKTSLSARISKGQGNEDDFKKMAFLTKELALNHPPKGDLASWTEKTPALKGDADSLAAGKPGALDGFKTAVNCKACHDIHKGK